MAQHKHAREAVLLTMEPVAPGEPPKHTQPPTYDKLLLPSLLPLFFLSLSALTQVSQVSH